MRKFILTALALCAVFAVSCSTYGGGTWVTSAGGEYSIPDYVMPSNFSNLDRSIFFFGDLYEGGFGGEGYLGYFQWPIFGTQNASTGLNFGWNMRIPEVPGFGNQYISVSPVMGLDTIIYMGDSEEDSTTNNNRKSNELYNVSETETRETGFGDIAVRAGVTVNVNLGKYFFLRLRPMYEFGFLSTRTDGNFVLGLGLGYRTEDDSVRENWRTAAEKKADEEARIERERKAAEDKRLRSEYDGYITRAQNAYKEQNYASALDYYGMANKAHRDSFPAFPVSAVADVYWARSRQKSGEGDYRGALTDVNEALKIKVGMTNSDYEYWKSVVLGFEDRYGEIAPVDYSILRVLPEMNLKQNASLSSLGFSGGEVLGSGFGSGTVYNMKILPGRRAFVFDWKRGTRYLNSIRREVEIRGRSVYSAKAEENGSQLTTSVVDVRNEELPLAIFIEPPKPGERIDSEKYERLSAPDRNGNVRWASKEHNAFGNIIDINLLIKLPWQKYTVITDREGIVRSVEVSMEARRYTEAEIARSTRKQELTDSNNTAAAAQAIVQIFLGIQAGKILPVHKTGDLNGGTVGLYKTEDNSSSIVVSSTKKDGLLTLSIIHRAGVDANLDRTLKLVEKAED